MLHTCQRVDDPRKLRRVGPPVLPVAVSVGSSLEHLGLAAPGPLDAETFTWFEDRAGV